MITCVIFTNFYVQWFYIVLVKFYITVMLSSLTYHTLHITCCIYILCLHITCLFIYFFSKEVLVARNMNRPSWSVVVFNPFALASTCFLPCLFGWGGSIVLPSLALRPSVSVNCVCNWNTRCMILETYSYVFIYIRVCHYLLPTHIRNINA